MNTSSTNKRECVGRYIRIFKRGAMYHADINVNGIRRRESLGTRNIKEARKRALDMDAKLRREGLCERPKRIELADAIERYLSHGASKGLRPSTLTRYRMLLGVFEAFAKAKGIRFLNQVNLLLVEAYLAAEKEAGGADKTLENRATVVKQLFKWAVQRELLDRDPLTGLKLGTAKAKPQPCFDLAQVEMILEASGEPYRSLFEVLAFSGMRIGEAVWLTWDDVDFARGFIHIRPKDDWVPKHGRTRVFPMHERVRAVLEQLPRSHRWVIPSRPGKGPQQNGGQLEPRHTLYELKRVLDKLGLKGKQHSFRHFFISHCANSGVPPFLLIKWVGHANVKTVMSYYSLTDEESLWRMRQLSAHEQAARPLERTAEAV